MAEKMRVHILAKQLNVSSKAVLLKCVAEGLDVKNHMTALGPGLEATIREWFSEGSHATTIETADRVDLKKVRVRKPRVKRQTVASGAVTSDTMTLAVEEPLVEEGTEPAGLALAEVTAPAPVKESPEPAIESLPGDSKVELGEPSEAPDVKPTEESVPDQAAAEVSSAPGGAAEQAVPAEPPTPEVIQPAGPQNVPAPAKLQGPRVVRYEAPDRDYSPPPRGPRPRSSPRPAVSPAPNVMRPPAPGASGAPGELPGRGRGKSGDQRKRGKSVSPRRATNRGSAAGAQEKLKEWRDQDLIERRERLEGATGRRVHRRRAMESHGGAAPSAPAGRAVHAQVQEPILVKAFCSAVGIPFIRLVKILQKDHNLMATINTSLPTEVAELVALAEGVELEVIKAKSLLEELQEEFDEREAVKLAARPPVVTLLGHVDHGKTSLLDAIRSAKIAAGEDGGITQHLSSYHLRRDGLAITFLDTPGHAAFTAMRARGANLTDIVVLIVAADDGVMPQTVEAINHAKAAGVPIVVAITKIDLGVYDEARIFGQLTEHELTPSGNWGGETDVIKTSSVTGEGLDELLEHLVALAEVLDLQADRAGDAAGAVVEAETREGVGAAVRVLVQRGELKPGAVVTCGNSYGKVRAIVDDQGQRLESAGPSIPCEIWGLDQVPSAGDKFYSVKSMQRAKSIAEEIRQQRTERARIGSQKALTLEDVFKRRNSEGIPELNLIIRADVDGSMHALKDLLQELPTDQIKLEILHTGVGAVVDSDVLLAQASASIVIAYRVSLTPTTRRLAEAQGVDVREYKVIYEVIEDITKAMEGLLEPERKMEHRGTVEVREVFKITKVGVVAGCYVTDGVVSRNHRVRLVRGGIIIRDDSVIGSLRRFKDDVKEVRAGMECGIRLERFDDLKQGDVIEALEVVEVARTL